MTRSLRLLTVLTSLGLAGPALAATGAETQSAVPAKTEAAKPAARHTAKPAAKKHAKKVAGRKAVKPARATKPVRTEKAPAK